VAPVHEMPELQTAEFWLPLKHNKQLYYVSFTTTKTEHLNRNKSKDDGRNNSNFTEMLIILVNVIVVVDECNYRYDPHLYSKDTDRNPLQCSGITSKQDYFHFVSDDSNGGDDSWQRGPTV
jgi:hypothetical protein